MYDKPIYMTYQLDAASLTSDADLLTVSGPYGKQGRVVAVTAVVTTGVTVAAAAVNVGSLTDDDDYAVLSVPVSSAMGS